MPKDSQNQTCRAFGNHYHLEGVISRMNSSKANMAVNGKTKEIQLTRYSQKIIGSTETSQSLKAHKREVHSLIIPRIKRWKYNRLSW